MFLYDGNDFELNGVVYTVQKGVIKKYNFNKRDKNGVAVKEKLSIDELNKLSADLYFMLRSQNKQLAKIVMRGA